MNYDIDFNKVISFLLSQQVQESLAVLKVVFILVSAVLLAGIVALALFKTHYLQWLLFQNAVEFFTFRPFGAKRITKNWNKITGRLETGEESEYKLALIEADQMFDSALKRMRFPGATFEERLEKLSSATLPNMEEIRKAHRLRNNIVHNPDQSLTLEEAQKTLQEYKKAFLSLQIIEK